MPQGLLLLSRMSPACPAAAPAAAGVVVVVVVVVVAAAAVVAPAVFLSLVVAKIVK